LGFAQNRLFRHSTSKNTNAAASVGVMIKIA
jgi:hypothetical protein